MSDRYGTIPGIAKDGLRLGERETTTPPGTQPDGVALRRYLATAPDSVRLCAVPAKPWVKVA